MKKNTFLAMGYALFLFLAACGGGSGSVDGGNQPAPIDSAVATLIVHSDSMEFLPAMIGNNLQHLSDGSKEINDIAKSKIVKSFWNDENGFHAADPAKGRELEVEAEVEHGQLAFKLKGVPISVGGIITFLLDDGRELSINTEPKWLKLVADSGMVAVRLASGLIRVSPAPPATPIPTPNPIPTPSASASELNIAAGQITYQSRIVGDDVVNLVQKNGEPEDMSLKHISSVQWVRASGERIPAIFNSQNGVAVVSGLSAVEDGIIVFVRDDGQERAISLAPDKLSRTGIASTVTPSGFIHFETSVPTPTQQPLHSISVVNGVMQITFATVDGFIVEVVKDGVATSLKIADVRRVFWNGDVAQWSLADSNPHGVTVTLPGNFPVTAINVPVHDNGIIRIVDIQGGVYSINTAKVTGLQLTTDGRQLVTY